MSNKNVTLKDENGNILYPKTLTSRVINTNNQNLDTLLGLKADAASAVTSVTVGTTTTGAAGSNASVTNSGTATAPVLNFTIPQGAKGDTGATGATGPQGERGPQGDTGVTVEAINSIIHSIDPATTYGADDVAGADAVQDIQEELTELSGEVSNVKLEIFGTSNVHITITKSVRFEETYGYTANKSAYACSNILSKGRYSLPANDTFFFGVYRYISDSSGEVRYAPSHNAKTFDVTEGDYAIISIQSNSTNALTNEEYAAISSWTGNITQVSGKTTLDEIRTSATSNTTAIAEEVARAKNEETTLKNSVCDFNIILNGNGKYLLDIEKKKRFADNGYTTNNSYCSAVLDEGTYDIPSLSETDYFMAVYKYVSDSEGTLKFAETQSSRSLTIYKNEKYIIVFRKRNLPALTDSDIATLSALELDKSLQTSLQEDVETIKNTIGVIDKADTEFATVYNKEVLCELYLPNATDSWTITEIKALSTGYRVKIQDENEILRIFGLDDVGTTYSDKVIKLITESTLTKNGGTLMGYVVLHYRGTDYSSSSSSSTLKIAAVKDLNKSPKIKEYLSREENLVLIGDSSFGKPEQNLLGNILSTMTKKQVFNCGFGGCQMAWRTSDGSNIYDKMSFVNIADAIASDDKTSEEWVLIRTTARKMLSEFPSTAVQRFAVSEAELEEIDFSKPTTIFLIMGGNDLSNREIGNLWNWDDELTDYDKQTMLGAFNYGVHLILSTYPHIRFIACLNRWTTYDSGETPDYAYEKKQQWLAALKQNCERMGISCCDVHNALGSNKWNKDYYQIDWTHQNIKGYVKMAKMLAAIDKSWLM